ncbi:hypothetical protein ACJRO7_009132 [Eucalyptus globulus]|uniref:glutathione transferase n=1 Tax=Eucalyptus globulus TaxID=34317 RepID=A0ABD3ITK4_EUCGL
MGVKLYGHPMSSCTVRVMACLYEKGVEFELPFGKIPILEDGDLTIFVQNTSRRFLQHHDPTTDDLLRSDSLEENIALVMSPIIFQHFVAPLQGKAPNQAIIDDNLAKLVGVLDVYKARLGKTNFKTLQEDFSNNLHHFPYMLNFMKMPWAMAVTDCPCVKARWE